MSAVKRIVLDVLKPHHPNVLDFARVIADLKDAVAKVKADPDLETEGVGRLYGMSANIPIKGVMDAFLKRYMDLVYKL